MTKKAERELIVDYVLQNESNLEVALKVCSAFNEIRKIIITNFLKELEIALKLDDEWEITNNFKKGLLNDCTFFIAKKGWGKKYQIGFRGNSGAKNFIIGICKNQDITQLFDSQKLTKLNEKYGPGNISNWWTWYRSVHEHYRNWDNEEVLMRMYKKDEKDDVITYFRDYILGIKQIAEPVIDEAVKSK